MTDPIIEEEKEECECGGECGCGGHEHHGHEHGHDHGPHDGPHGGPKHDGVPPHILREIMDLKEKVGRLEGIVEVLLNKKN